MEKQPQPNFDQNPNLTPQRAWENYEQAWERLQQARQGFDQAKAAFVDLPNDKNEWGRINHQLNQAIAENTSAWNNLIRTREIALGLGDH